MTCWGDGGADGHHVAEDGPGGLAGCQTGQDTPDSLAASHGRFLGREQPSLDQAMLSATRPPPSAACSPTGTPIEIDPTIRDVWERRLAAEGMAAYGMVVFSDGALLVGTPMIEETIPTGQGLPWASGPDYPPPDLPRLGNAVRYCRPEDRAILHLTYQRGMGQTDIADLLGITQPSVWSRLASATARVGTIYAMDLPLWRELPRRLRRCPTIPDRTPPARRDWPPTRRVVMAYLRCWRMHGAAETLDVGYSYVQDRLDLYCAATESLPAPLARVGRLIALMRSGWAGSYGPPDPSLPDWGYP